MRPVYAQAKTAGTIADAVTRGRLTRWLGVEWTSARNGIVELAGVPESVREHFSARHAEILEEAAARGWGTSPAALAVLQRETRDHKPRIDRARAQADWRARAAEHGLGAEELRGLLGRARPVREAQRRARVAARVEWMASSAGLTAHSSTFTRGQVLEALAAGHPEGVRAEQLEAMADAFLAKRAVTIVPARVEPGRGRVAALWTTPEHLAVEARLIEIASGEHPAAPLVAPEKAVERAIAARPTLGQDQAAAVRALCGGRGRVRVLEARAGSGKSYALTAVREAYASAGVPVIGTAWQGRAAEVLGREAGVESQTTALLLERLARGEEPIPQGAVVIVDEAGTMPTHAMERLLTAVVERGGRVILAGDSRQLPAIAAGGALAGLAERLGPAELTGNRRQADGLQREVVARLSTGDAAGALALLSEHERLQGFEDAREARAALIARWTRECLHQPERAMILAHDRREVAELNALARAEREAAGLLGAERLLAGGREWAVGDRLTCRRNDYRLGVRNGTRGTVVTLDRLDRSLTLRTDDGRTSCLPAGYLAHAEHGYAATGHVSQGETVERTYLLAIAGRGGREWAYVAGSRHLIDLRVYVVDHDGERLEEGLAAAWSRSQAQRLALDLARTERRAAAVAEAQAQPAGELPARLAELRREREALGAVLRTYPEGAASRVRALRAEAERTGARVLALAKAAEVARETLAAMPVWRGRKRHELAREAAGFEREAASLRDARDAARQRAAAIEQGPDGPGRWEAAHPGGRAGGRAGYRAVTLELRALKGLGKERGIELASVVRSAGPTRAPDRRSGRHDYRDLGVEL